MTTTCTTFYMIVFHVTQSSTFFSIDKLTLIVENFIYHVDITFNLFHGS